MAADGRVAIYYAPRQDDPLAELAASWLGRDPSTGVPVRQPALPAIDEVTAEPRRYGFHATLKPPMRLAEGRTCPDLLRAVNDLAATVVPFELPRLAVHNLHGFLALRETIPCPPLQALADICVEQLDPFRAPATDAEMARRRSSRLSMAHEAMLARWGYPYVFEEWFFHMTLTRRLTADEHTLFMPAAEEWFAAALDTPRRVTDICVFTQSGPDAPFQIADRIPLRG
jgi:putative phosphonate metabolism protein